MSVDVCWLMLIDVDYVDWCWLMLIDVDICWFMLIYVDVCWLMLIYVDVCWCMLIYVDFSWLLLRKVLISVDFCWFLLISVGFCDLISRIVLSWSRLMMDLIWFDLEYWLPARFLAYLYTTFSIERWWLWNWAGAFAYCSVGMADPGEVTKVTSGSRKPWFSNEKRWFFYWTMMIF